ncbi:MULTISPECIES: sugar transferase [Priestia]|uniref:Glycosyltransferase n=1 Tax=Priestia megaterium (strain ATCC 12872 / QMB1551) TaxID=545693 RepID=D5DY68_PRIM1|nr:MULTISPECIES: sugar transferase [Priestia]MDH6655964.1 exopolysaccharide biosynthesis polyprenyl glycosylphosphotransferase [Bacillus sp. PvP124]ADE68150.1 glycosyltransferase [Priestia megaterium QM B1551]MBG9934174.1 multidrug MFS transporter [Priestia aryabhattai]MED3941479.1 sugar transferase [Priestia megaterium]MED4091372.1 sugar transferase [Priestia megaterium]
MTQIAKKKATLKTHASQNFAELSGNESLVYLGLKRTLDIIGSLIGIILLSIVFILVALAIKVEDPKGPIFFSQERIGKKGKNFKMYKFRSMVTDAETKLTELLQLNETTGAMFKMKNDPRVTRIGRLIRKTSIDELPQLFNVLKGEMSLVGPRPPLPREVAEYTNYDKKRLIVTPGCTGIWQVSGRSNIGFKEMVELDLYYIKNQSISMDVKIIFKTIVLLFGSKNAF